MKNNSDHLLRSLFFIPGHIQKYIDKIETLKADVFILDLEDSVPLAEKDKARSLTSQFLKSNKALSKKIIVRINEFDLGFLLNDLDSVLCKNLFGIMPSKIHSQNDIIFYDKLLSQYETKLNINSGHFKLLPLVETLDAFLNVGDIAKSSGRLIGLAFGGEDYLNELGGEHGLNDHTFDYPRTRIAIAAKSANLQAIDTPYLDVQNHTGFIQREKKSKDLGYEGCLLIHPSQIEKAHLCFSPTEEEVKFANSIQESVEDSKCKGLSVVLMNGVLVGPPMQKKAAKIIGKMELINKKINE